MVRIKLWVFVLHLFFLNKVFASEGMSQAKLDIGNSEICVVSSGSGEYDLSPLRKWNPWYVSVNSNGSIFELEISICEPLKAKTENDPCEGASVCLIKASHRSLMTNYDNKTMKGLFLPTPDNFWIELEGPLCNVSKDSFRRNQTILLNMKCGENLGSPVLLYESSCSYTFSWITSVACLEPKKSKKAQNEVPCTTYDSSGRLYDLSPLIKSKGGYKVDNEDSFFINVCSDLTADGESGGCPDNSAACWKIGEQFIAAGKLKKPLGFNKNQLELTYEMPKGSFMPEQCSEPPKTVINFICPKRGKGKNPKILFKGDCLFQIYWETEFACPTSVLNGNLKTCAFEQNQHGINIDLSPLRKKDDEMPYSIAADVDGKSMIFLMNICGGFGNSKACNISIWSTTSVCLEDVKENQKTILGSTNNAQLRYIDGTISLTYLGRSNCNGGKNWKTVINFVCDNSKGNGANTTPKFIGKEDCTYIFEMSTSLACVKERILECSLGSGSLQINFDPFRKSNSVLPWTAMDGVSSIGQSREIFLNFCGIFGANNKCPPNSSICMIGKNDTKSLGSGSIDSLSYSSSNNVSSYEAIFLNGSPCTNGTIKSQIKMTCQEGAYTNSPILVSESDCLYQFEWMTADACPEGNFEFDQCKFVDSKSGMTIDLNSLKSKTAYQIETDKHLYAINVCGPVSGTKCNDLGMVNARGCQIEKNVETGKAPIRAWNLGETPIAIVYDDGEFINLTYTGGSPYRDIHKTPRSMSLTFICDPLAGKGTPAFIGEENRAYGFIWKTSLVCSPGTSTEECFVSDPLTNTQYDLSSLSKKSGSGDWSFISLDGKRKFYLNICRPLVKSQLGQCTSQSAACVSDIDDKGNESNFISLGQALERPTIGSAGRLQLHYSMGSECNSYRKDQNFTATINFLCSSTSTLSGSEGPRFLKVLGNCNYSFLWATEAACPIGKQEFHGCRYTHPFNGFTYDLNPLKQADFYEVKGKDRNFQLNICGSVSSNGCLSSNASNLVGACELDKTGKSEKVIGFIDSEVVESFVGSTLHLTYIGASNSKTVIAFGCDRRPIAPDISFDREDSHGNYYFTANTQLVCPPIPVECNTILESNGKEYNLKQLNRNVSQLWSVEDSKAKLNYFVNICGSITGLGGPNCHGAGACKVNPSEPFSGESLGTQDKPPEIADDGTVVIRLTNGSPCVDTDLKSSASIVLSCSTAQKPLILELVTPECEHIFRMETPAACPIQTSMGSSCTVKDKIFGHFFDLNPLRNATFNYKAQSSDKVYTFNVCGEIINPVKGCEGSAVCQINVSDLTRGVSYGKPSQELIYHYGLIKLNYQTDLEECGNQKNRTSTVTFICDHSAIHSSQNDILIVEDVCSASFVLPTVLACPPFELLQCTANDDIGQHYDLSDLSLPNKNYMVGDPFDITKLFVINICRTIVHKPNSLCPYRASACQINVTDPNPTTSTIDLGTIMNPPSFEDGALIIKYSLGSRCKINGDFKFFETVIEFRCDEDEEDSEPEFLYFFSCQYRFIWYTKKACPVRTSEKISPNCSITNPKSGQLLDFSSLRNDNGIAIQSLSHTYILNICGEIKGSPCGKGVGVCQSELNGETRTFNGGQSNSNIHYHQGALYLNYIGGTPCHQGKYKRNTIIQFICDPTKTKSAPVFVSESFNCTYLFNWHTHLACQNKEFQEDAETPDEILDCSVLTKTGLLDLSSLRSDKPFTYMGFASEAPGVFMLNVCEKIQPSIIKFPDDAAAGCSHCFDQEVPLSFGRFTKKPYIDIEGRIILDYTNGSVCPSNPLKNMSSQIFFECAQKKAAVEPLGPVGDGCTYAFVFETYLVCPPKIDTCEIGVKEKGFHLNLMKYKAKTFNVSDGNNTIMISLCAPLANNGPCSGASVCMVSGNNSENFGLSSSTSAYHNGAEISYTLESNSTCVESATGKKGTEIRFHCEPNAGLGSPQLYMKTSCNLMFLWESSDVCLPTIPPVCALWTKKDELFDLRILSSISHSWSIMGENGTMYLLNLCREVNEQTLASTNSSCPPFSSVCFFNKGMTEGVSLGNVLTQKLRRDEETQTLLLTYTRGDNSICPKSGLYNSENDRVSTEIRFICGNQLGFPVFISGPTLNDCTFKFEWKTNIACADREDIPVMERNGIVYDTHLKGSQFIFNMTSIFKSSFNVEDPNRNENYFYIIDLGKSGKSNVTDPQCKNAAVCQTKSNGTFFRDLGSWTSRKFFIRGSELKLSLTSYGRKCGKNKSKNVTTVINFECSSSAGLGKPTFSYESGDCDYLFQWETSAVCINTSLRRPDILLEVAGGGSSQSGNSTGSHFTTSAIIGIIFAVVLTLIVIGVAASKERRSAIKVRVKSCFQKVNLPKYQYMQCYFLRFGRDRGSQLSRNEGEAVLLAPDDPLPKYQDDSDTDPIA